MKMLMARIFGRAEYVFSTEKETKGTTYAEDACAGGKSVAHAYSNTHVSQGGLG